MNIVSFCFLSPRKTLRAKLYVFILSFLLVGCQKDANGIGFQIDGGNETAAMIESIKIKNIVPQTDDSLDVTFEIKNTQLKDICLIREVLGGEFSVFAELQMKLPTGTGLALSSKGFRFTNYDIVTLEAGDIRENTLTFATLKQYPHQTEHSLEYRISVGGVYCSTMTDDYFPIDFILQSDWVGVKRLEQ